MLSGDRAILLKFFGLLFDEWDKIYNSDNGMVDMYLSNMITYKHFSENYVTGIGVINNVFKSMKPTVRGEEYWLHK